jgi:4-diphosphocytidyl-2-C-methyl-D-erythritol kinase
MNSSYFHYLAPAKLNLTLKITGRRADGYHLLDSHFCFIDLMDEIWIRPTLDGHICLETPLAGVAAENDLVVRAAKLLQTAAKTTQGASIKTLKRIPMGAGLGGGSSDAATVLMALNQLWNLHWPRERLMALGLTLGADVPFFIFGQAAKVTGIGENMSALPVTPSSYVLIKPPVHADTARVFKAYAADLADESSKKDLTNGGALGIMRTLSNGENTNDLQDSACRVYPEIEAALRHLNSVGSYFPQKAIMTGSGACVFMAASKIKSLEILANLPKDYVGFLVNTFNQHPFYCG